MSKSVLNTSQWNYISQKFGIMKIGSISMNKKAFK